MQIVVHGNGATLDGHTTSHGLIVYGGSVTFEDPTVANTVAQGGDGVGSAGAGAGLGGGLFVANNSGVPGNVTLSNVDFVNTKAAGGLTAFIRSTDSRASTGGGGGLFGGTGGYPEAYTAISRTATPAIMVMAAPAAAAASAAMAAVLPGPAKRVSFPVRREDRPAAAERRAAAPTAAAVAPESTARNSAHREAAAASAPTLRVPIL